QATKAATRSCARPSAGIGSRSGDSPQSPWSQSRDSCYNPAMLSVAEAQKMILEQARPLPAEPIPLSTRLLGMVLAEDVASDLEVPPFDKAMMDGYAVRSPDLEQGQATLTVIEEVNAGQTPQLPVGPGQATRIMTGAPVPPGVDSVVMVERCQLLENRQVRVDDASFKPGQHILGRGREMHQGETVLQAGARLRPQEIGLLATVGQIE